VERDCLGVVGGMGPLVSAEFLKTIYAAGSWTKEQDAPRVILYSDPTFPDRTELLLRGDEEPLARQLGETIERLLSAGASHIVIACVTIHRVLPRLPWPLRSRVISLIETALGAVAASDERHLLFCTTGTRRMRLFEGHDAWPAVRDRILLPSERDQSRIHELIYQVKGRQEDDLLPTVEALLEQYGVRSFIAGCTELHLASTRLGATTSSIAFIDPLTVIARRVADGGLLGARARFTA
jgi:aspartate racemase